MHANAVVVLGDCPFKPTGVIPVGTVPWGWVSAAVASRDVVLYLLVSVRQLGGVSSERYTSPGTPQDALHRRQADVVFSGEVDLSRAVGELRRDGVECAGFEAVFDGAGQAGVVASAGVVLTGVTVDGCLVLGVPEPIQQSADLAFCVRASDPKDHQNGLWLLFVTLITLYIFRACQWQGLAANPLLCRPGTRAAVLINPHHSPLWWPVGDWGLG